ncbi:MAG: hypothetical protein HY922_05070 [Elusimicrobia bacterium]|nr:hypothetical protein [Elusimicrobiota bacterium]
MTIRLAALSALLSLPLLAWPCAAGEPPTPSDCEEGLQFEAEGGKAIRIGLTGSPEAGVYASEDAVSVLSQSPGGEFRIVFSSGALKAIADINKYRTDFFAKNRLAKGQEMTPNCLGTLRFNAKKGRLGGAYRPRKARGFELWHFDFNLKGETALVSVAPGKGDPPIIYVDEELKDGGRSDGLAILPFDFHKILVPKISAEPVPKSR